MALALCLLLLFLWPQLSHAGWGNSKGSGWNQSWQGRGYHHNSGRFGSQGGKGSLADVAFVLDALHQTSSRRKGPGVALHLARHPHAAEAEAPPLHLLLCTRSLKNFAGTKKKPKPLRLQPEKPKRKRQNLKPVKLSSNAWSNAFCRLYLHQPKRLCNEGRQKKPGGNRRCQLLLPGSLSPSPTNMSAVRVCAHGKPWNNASLH